MKKFFQKILRSYRGWPKWGKITFWFFATTYALAGVNYLLTGESLTDSSRASRSQQDVIEEEKTLTLEEKQALANDDLKSLLSGNTNYGQPRLERAIWSPQSLVIHAHQNPNPISSWTKRTLYDESIKIMRKLFPNHDFIQRMKIIWYTEGTNVSGQKEVFHAMRMSIERTEFEKVNWRRFIPEDLPLITEDYWQHPNYFD